MKIKYKVNHKISGNEFRQLLIDSTLGDRRPVADPNCIDGMIENSNLVVTAWDHDHLIGIARSMTDFYFACYLSDLAVHTEYQKTGIGKKLIEKTQDQLGAHCNIILLAAPVAKHYYPKIGFTHHDSCWVLSQNHKLSD